MPLIKVALTGPIPWIRALPIPHAKSFGWLRPRSVLPSYGERMVTGRWLARMRTPFFSQWPQKWPQSPGVVNGQTDPAVTKCWFLRDTSPPQPVLLPAIRHKSIQSNSESSIPSSTSVKIRPASQRLKRAANTTGHWSNVTPMVAPFSDSTEWKTKTRASRNITGAGWGGLLYREQLQKLCRFEHTMFIVNAQ